MLTSIRAPLQLSNLQNQPKEVFSSDLYISKATCFNFGLDPINITMVVSYDIDPDTSRLQTQTWFVTFLIFELKPDITMPTSLNILISYYIYTDLFKLDNSDEIGEY